MGAPLNTERDPSFTTNRVHAKVHAYHTGFEDHRLLFCLARQAARLVFLTLHRLRWPRLPPSCERGLQETVEENPIWQKKDWEGKSMSEFYSEGFWGSKACLLFQMTTAATIAKSAFGSKTVVEPAKPAPRFRVCSFNVLAQCYVNAVRFPYTTNFALKWRHRRVQLMKEVLSYNADVLCLQELDNYQEWWQGRMGLAGYDGVYFKKDGSNKDGLAIFYKRDLFQLFKTSEIHFNDLDDFLPQGINPERAKTDDVGLIVGLQPWEESPHPTANGVANVQLQSDPT